MVILLYYYMYHTYNLGIMSPTKTFHECPAKLGMWSLSQSHSESNSGKGRDAKNCHILNLREIYGL